LFVSIGSLLFVDPFAFASRIL